VIPLNYQPAKDANMSVLSIEQFLSVIKKYKNRKITQENAIKELDEIHKSIIKKNNKSIVSIMEKNKFYEDIRYTQDELIIVYDKSMNSTSDFERIEYEKRLKSKIGDAIVERTSMIQPDEYEMVTEKYYEELKDTIYQERREIAKLCQENREITNCYEKFKVEIIENDIQILLTKIPPVDEHYLMQILRIEAKQAYEYMKKAIDIRLVQYTSDGLFNFQCDKGCVGLFFSTVGYTDFKRISPWIKINNEPCNVGMLQNGAKHGKTDEWDSISKIIFGDVK
jgi:hypothetical protein